MISQTLPDLTTPAFTHQDSAVATLGITFTPVGEDFLEGCMPVDARTVQPMGILHGGATPVHLGRMTQVWPIDIRDDQEYRVCVARLTMAVLPEKRAP